MAEKIVSPGVFTREKDLSFLPQGIGEIGAVVIGPTIKGPAFLPTVVESFADFEIKFGGVSEKTYVPYTVQQYLNSAGRVTIVRVLGLDGYSAANLLLEAFDNVLAVLAPSAKNATRDVTSKSVIAQNAASSTFNLTLSGSSMDGTILSAGTGNGGIGGVDYSCSLDSTSDTYIEKVFGTDAQTTLTEAYLYKHWADALTTYKTASITLDPDTLDFANDTYAPAYTPWITSQNNDKLFRLKTRSDGTNTNTEFKVSVYDIKKAGDIAGSEYGAFSLAVRVFSDEDKSPQILETFQGLNLDPLSSNYVLKMIGDRYSSIDADGKLTYHGDWPNKSEYVYVDPQSTLETSPKDLVPFGHSSYKTPISASLGEFVPAPSWQSGQLLEGEYSNKVHYGVKLDDIKPYQQNAQIFSALPSGISSYGTTEAGADRTGSFSLGNQVGTDNSPSGYLTSSDSITLSTAHINQLKYTLGFQGGFDGYNPARVSYVGSNIDVTNLYGYSFSGTTSEGQKAWKKALNAVSNPDEFDINMVLTPGIVANIHTAIVTHAKNMCESRGDCFYIVDCTKAGQSITQATDNVKTQDSNYMATYYPWVKIVDTSLAKPVWVPPSVVLSGVVAYTDKVSHEWFAPAGLNRGGLTSVIEAETRLTHEERDDLYESRVNPIASFPGQGVCVWGQKTLQGKPSALDRINVRRLLIKCKKFIASASRYLVFEQNTSATRARFLNIANPFLESVQANSGLSAFKVVMDDTNNTPDIVDRNILYGQIFLQPTRTAEFIVLDFNILPTGAAFPE